MNLGGLRAKDGISRSLDAVVEMRRASAKVIYGEFNFNRIAVYQWNKVLRLDLYGREADAFFVKESLIGDSAVRREEFFHANMAVMQDARIVNEADRIAVSKTDGDARGKRH